MQLPPITRGAIENARPFFDRVLIMRLTDEYHSAAGIVIPGKHAEAEPANYGLVIAVGPGKLNDHTMQPEPMMVKVGDVVIFGKYSGQAVHIIGDHGHPQEYIVCRQFDIFAKIGEVEFEE